MGRFIGGFLVATLLWGGAFAAYEEGLLDEFLADDEPIEVASAPEEPAQVVEEEPEPRRRRRRRGRRGMRRGMRGASMDSDSDGQYAMGSATTGDDLDLDGPRDINAAVSGGEARLSSSQVEAGFDGAFRGIQRCLILVDSDAPLRGRLTFGLRIAGTGRVTRVNLSGPAAVTRGEPGSCLRTAARRIRFPTFDGPEMVVHYPITLE